MINVFIGFRRKDLVLNWHSHVNWQSHSVSPRNPPAKQGISLIAENCCETMGDLPRRGLSSSVALVECSECGTIPECKSDSNERRESLPHQVIIDADPGIGDALAILLALSDPRLDVLALTSTAGV